MPIEMSEAAGGKGAGGKRNSREHQKQYLIRMTKQI